MEVALVDLVVAVASTGLADLSTLAAIRTQIDGYRSVHGQWPASRDAVRALLSQAPRFQCAGNDYTYDSAGGAVGLLIMDPRRR